MTKDEAIDVEAERKLFEREMNAQRFFPAELDFSRGKSPSGRDEYVNSHLQSNWNGWLAAKRSIAANTGTIDTPEFKFLAEFWAGKAYSSQPMVRQGFREAWTALIAHIDARLNAAPICPECRDRPRFKSNWLNIFDGEPTSATTETPCKKN